jgi:hypothetical protein
MSTERSHWIIVEHLDMYLHGYQFTASATNLYYVTPQGGSGDYTGALLRDAEIGLRLN